MSEYRDDVRQVAKDTTWTIGKFIIPFLLLVLVLTVGGFIANSLGLFGRTVVEREVFEESYQRTEAIKSQIATDEATLAEIERKLANPNLDANTRFNLEAQASAARIRIATAKGKQ